MRIIAYNEETATVLIPKRQGMTWNIMDSADEVISVGEATDEVAVEVPYGGHVSLVDDEGEVHDICEVSGQVSDIKKAARENIAHALRMGI